MAATASGLRNFARRLRREQTEAERKLWRHLRSRQLSYAKLRRPHPIGSFVVDFCCPERRLVIELDGSQHATRVEADQRRSLLLTTHGYSVLRFWNNEVMETMDAVLDRIALALNDPHLSPLPKRARKTNPRERGSE